ncbi:MAG: peptide chain release factor N(5)-glutamine methyltransferase [Myxococcota bacterium]
MSAAGAGKDKTWTVLELLTWTTDYFKRAGIESARLDAEVLLAHALETERLRLYIDYEKPVLPEERDAYRGLVQRRAQDRIPVSQLLGEREFWSLPFKITGDVLTPRPETETLVEWALSKTGRGTQEGGQVPEKEGKLRILDIGTGSGAIALALASELPHASVTATDLSAAALQIARKNADELRTGERIRFVEGDLFEPLESEPAKEGFDLIVSNPPYVARKDEGVLPPELSHEPEMALFAGPDGLDVIRRLVAKAGDHLSSGGWLGLELSPEQADEVEGLLREAGFTDVERRFDLASRARVVGARKP